MRQTVAHAVTGDDFEKGCDLGEMRKGTFMCTHLRKMRQLHVSRPFQVGKC